MPSYDLTHEADVQKYVTELTGRNCISTKRISGGGYSAFVYRVEFDKPLENGDKTAIVKHFDEHAANRAFTMRLGCERAEHEGSVMAELAAMRDDASQQHPGQVADIPRLILSDKETHTLLMQDVGSLPSLKSWLSSDTPLHVVRHVGSALGSFLAGLHDRPLGAYAALGNNEPGRNLSGFLYYGGLVAAAARFGHQDADAVLTRAAEQGEREVREASEVFTAGDFWTGNVLIDDGQRSGPARPEDVAVWILDFELSKPGTAEFDIGQMAAEMHSLAKFRDHERGTALLQSFLSTYAKLRRADPAKVAIRLGAHQIVIGPMGWSAVAGEEEIGELVREGVELVRLGWQGDEAALSASIVGPLFASN